MTPFRTVCLALPEREARSREHFAERGVDAQFFYGINAAKAGLHTIHPYEVDGGPGCGFFAGQKHVGIWLGHRMLWSALQLLPDDVFFVLEGDAQFDANWRERVDRALSDVPADWDLLYIGSCCCGNRHKQPVRGEVFEVKWPLCNHAYMVRRKALPTLIWTQDAAKCYAPMDLSMMFHSFAHLRVYTMLPRAVAQWETGIEP